MLLQSPKFLNALQRAEYWPEPLGRIAHKISRKLVNAQFKYRHNRLQLMDKIIDDNVRKLCIDIYDYSDLNQLTNRDYEKNLFDFYRNILENDDVFIDVGTNIGLHSLVAKTAAPGCKIIAVEASKSCCEKIERTAKANNFENFTLIPYGLHSKNGELELQYIQDNSGSGTLFADFGNDEVNPNYLKTETIQTKNLATIFKEENVETAKILKMDIQGGELEILTSMPAAFLDAQKITYILFEANISWQEEFDKEYQRYKKAGYRLCSVENGGELSECPTTLHAKKVYCLAAK